MKKLLSLLAAASIFSSSAALAVACKVDVKEQNMDNVDFNQDDTSNYSKNPSADILCQFAKGLFVSQNSLENLGLNVEESLKSFHYSSQDYLEYIKNEPISSLNYEKNFDKNFSADDDASFGDLYDKYFNEDLVAKELKTNNTLYKGKVLSSANTLPDAVNTINTILPLLANSLASPTISGITSIFSLLVTFQGQIGAIKDDIEPYIKMLGENNDQILKDLEDAFSFSKTDVTYVDAIQNSIVGLANSINGMLNITTKVSSFDDASVTIAKNIDNLINGNLKFSFDTNSIKYIPGVVKFVRVLSIYLDNFSEDQVTNKKLKVEDVLKVKQGQISKSSDGKLNNGFDFAKWISIFKTMVNDPEKGLTIFKNIINILFSTHDTPGYGSNEDETDETDISGIGEFGQEVEYKNDKEIYARIIGDVAVELLGKTIDINGVNKKYYVSNLVKSLINKGIGYNSGLTLDYILKIIPSIKDMLPESFKTIFDKFSELEWNKLCEDWIGYIWNNKTNVLGVNIYDLFSTPVDQMSNKFNSLLDLFTSVDKKYESDVDNNKDGIFDDKSSFLEIYFGSRSLKDYINELGNSLKQYETQSVNFDTLANLFHYLYEGDYTLKKAWNNTDQLLSGLGLNADGTSRQNSPMYYVTQLLYENRGIIKGLIEIVQKELASINQKIDSLKSAILSIKNEIKVSYEEASSTQFLYTVSYKNKTMQFKIQIIKKDTKYQVNGINYISN
ncbi:hypothetical protein SHELI_v1c09360 [Spiroplasma helicoides]|uniref:MOLPALP family lipoprotein n=1 Tax=Spiroplasma helicoides TaxID=216938 RepID=A0A1B3SLS6_9MOLU|nr:hypothetical protein [Spiroplasma helicoides]AOG60885.1 hypothetical protein SHELI_v1c09360 [Spiroplasma helicoides]